MLTSLLLIEGSVSLYRITLDIVNGISSTRCTERAFVPAMGLDIRDIRFIDDQKLLLALSDQSR